MNTEYKRVALDSDVADKIQALVNQKPATVPADKNIPHGDMPGDKIEIEDSHVAKAETIFPELARLLAPIAEKNPYGRTVVCVCGGSGVGKSEIASLLSFYLNEAGIGSYTLSGDNYPHRIPMYNDAERLHVFRENGIRGMVDASSMNSENFALVQKWQQEDDDANKTHIDEYPWFKSYIDAGSKALAGYLGTRNETDYDEVTSILKAFKDGADKIWLRRMGRDMSSLWYDEVDFSDTKVLIVEWTHGNSDYIDGVDVPVLLNSTPEETLAHRRSRARDGKVDSAFTTLVLNIEQRELHNQAHKAKIIISKDGKIISYDEYCKLMDGQF
ncbi:adenylyl-sulfate kinase [Butyrivibrio sp. NC3005]|uniref:adenylyl-sulfate kinase n=1 Tax=Butyrivibrio sp. NC3005 TaxID=1280685 RepID=UPI0003F90F4B|nr:adenylyl-sulfate kinase [Butyrivibrio sp. NC3005]